MNDSLLPFVDALLATGGSVALAFLMALVVGIAANALLFLGSAVVVLERFARSVRHPLSLLLASLLWAALLGALAADRETLEGLGMAWPGGLEAWALGSAACLASMIVAQGIVALLLRFTAPRALGVTSLVLLAAGFSLWLGGLARPGYSLVAALASGAAWLVFRIRRRRRGGAAAGDDERLAAWLAGVLALGVAVPLLLAERSFPVQAAGSATISLLAWFAILGLLPLATAGLLDLRGSVEWFIARRYLFAKRRQTFISLITGICVAGVAVGVWLIITVLSVMNGFESVWRDEIIGNRAHLTVHDPLGPMKDYRHVLEVAEQVPDVVGASPYLEADGMVRGRGGEIVGVKVRGIDPKRIVKVTDLEKDLLPGSEHALDGLAPAPGADGALDPGIVIGSQLASAVGVGIGDPLILISPFGGPPTPFGPGPRLQRFRVAGIFQSSFFQYDEAFTYISLAAAQEFRRVGDVANGIEVRTSDYYRSREVGREIERRLGFPYFTRDWKEFFPAFFQALKTERVMMFVLLAMIMVVAAFAIVVTLVMMIMEKSADIAILKAMGASDAAIERIFAIEGTLIGLLGTGLGVVSGIAVTTQLGWVQDQIEAITGVDTLPASIYQFSKLPWEIDPVQVGLVVSLAMVLALGATLLPSRHGARLDPAEALRHE